MGASDTSRRRDPPSTGAVIVTTADLGQRDPGALIPADEPSVPASIRPVDDLAPEISVFLYTPVGGDWFWLGWLAWILHERFGELPPVRLE